MDIKTVVLIGPPGSGKTSLWRQLRLRPTNDDIAITFLPETATELFNFAPKAKEAMSVELFQGAIGFAQRIAEAVAFETLKQSSASLGIVVLDRGIHDQSVYSSSKSLNDTLGIKEDFTSYDLVIFLEGEFQGDNGNPFRLENPQEVTQLHKLTYRVWKKRTPPANFITIPYVPSIEQKTELCVEAINNHFHQIIFKEEFTDV